MCVCLHVCVFKVQLMMDIVDPISYKDRYEGLPKLICDATGDEFFLPDDWRYWYTHTYTYIYTHTHTSRHTQGY